MPVTKQMMLEFRNASARRREALKRQKDEESEFESARKKALLEKKNFCKKRFG